MKLFVLWGGSGVKPHGLHIILHIYIHINQPDSDTWHQCVGPRVHTSLATNDTCQHPIGKPPSNKNMPRHQTTTSSWWYGSATWPYRLYGQVQSTLFFPCLTFRTNRYIFRSRHPFETKQIALGSWWRGIHSHLFWGNSENVDFWAKI